MFPSGFTAAAAFSSSSLLYGGRPRRVGHRPEVSPMVSIVETQDKLVVEIEDE